MVCRNFSARVVWGLSLAASVGTMACSSDDSSQSPSYSPFDSGTVVVPEAGAPAHAMVSIQIQGQGTVESSDAQPGDAGFVGQTTCGSGSPASDCTARLDTTLYAIPAVGWVFQGWTSTALPTGTDLGSGSSAYTVAPETPNPLIVVFAPQNASSHD
jgi:hypothetical protein